MTFFRPGIGQKGGATLNMFMFLLLMVSTGLMYYYFNRCKTLEHELARWRTGVAGTKYNDADIAANEMPGAKSINLQEVSDGKKPNTMSTIKNMATQFGSRLTGTPAVKPITINASDVTAQPTVTPRPGKLDLADQTPVVAARAEATPVITPTPPPTPVATATPQQEEEQLPSPAKTPQAKPAETAAVHTPKVKVTDSEPGRPTATPSVRQTPIGSLYDVAPPVRVKAPRRTPPTNP